MRLNANEYVSEKNFEIKGVSYIGNPKSYTAMYLTKKAEYLLNKISVVENCLVFIENGTNVADSLKKKHAFVITKNPLYEYSVFAKRISDHLFNKQKKLKYHEINGSYLCEDSIIGDNTYIYPGCVIGPNVSIGSDTIIHSGVKIKNARVDNNVIINENAAIGVNAFNFSNDDKNNRIRIPTLGGVIIKSDVEIGSFNNICAGIAGDTIIEKYSKLDSLIHVAHDVHIGENCEIVAGAMIGGFVNIGKNTFLGIGSAVKNRTSIGSNSLVGMSSTVLKDIEDGVVVVGVPARTLRKI